MLGILGLAIVLGTGWLWLRLIRRVAIPRQRTPFLLSFLVGGLVGLVGVVQGSGIASTVSGGIAALVGFLFLVLRAQSAQKPNEPAVRVGEPILAFTAPDEMGVDFDLRSLSGKPYLLKFFRGHW